MLPKTHFLAGLIFSGLIYLLFPELNLIYLFIFFLSTFLIDFDHYLYYIYKYKNYNLMSAYKLFRKNSKFFNILNKNERRNYTSGIFIFHGVETIIISFFLGLLWEGFYFVGLGIVFHLILDYIEKFRNFHPPTKVSIFYDLIVSKKFREVPSKL
ncbi:hypothetical protein GW932_01290 [archaeon]|nr:hypothetical protein [archaeon]